MGIESAGCLLHQVVADGEILGFISTYIKLCLLLGCSNSSLKCILLLLLLYFTCRPPADGWKYSSGFINEDMLRAHMLPAGPDAIVAMCGPPPMIKFACIPNLEKIGFTEEQLITF